MKVFSKFKSVFLCVCVLTLLISCTNSLFQENLISNSATPYASTETLEDLVKSGYVDYRISRFFALNELVNFTELYSWSGASLSERPIVIYNIESEKPRFYEFRVIKGTEEIGAIACVANCEEGDPVQYVMPYANKFDTATSRAVKKSAEKLFDVSYPRKLVSKDIQMGRFVTTESREAIDIEETDVDVKIEDVLLSADEQLLIDLGIDSSDIYDEYLRQVQEEKERVDSLWQEIMAVSEQILAVSDEEVLISSNARKALTSETEFTLIDWVSKGSWFNFAGYCGPNAVAFIALGFGEKSGYPNIPLRNDFYKLRDFYATFQKKIGTGPKLMSQLSKGLSDLTDYKIKNDIFHLWDTISSNIKKTNMPSISLRSSKSLTADGLAWHYRDIIGIKTKNFSEKKKFLWWTWESKSSENWYLMHDNGSDSGDGKNFWEKSGKIYQLWSGHVVEK